LLYAAASFVHYTMAAMFLVGFSRVKSQGGMKNKGKIVPVCTMKHYGSSRCKASFIMGAVDVRHHSFFTSVLDEVSGQHHYTASFLPGQRSPITLNRRLYGPRVGLDILEKRKILHLFQESNHDSLVMISRNLVTMQIMQSQPLTR